MVGGLGFWFGAGRKPPRDAASRYELTHLACSAKISEQGPSGSVGPAPRGAAHRPAHGRGVASLVELEPPLRDEGGRGLRQLTGLLQQPHAALGPRGSPRPVWNCSVRATPEDRTLSDDEWAQVACEIMHRTGPAWPLRPGGRRGPLGRGPARSRSHPCRRHAGPPGRHPALNLNDYFHVGVACRAAEQRFGLRPTAPRDCAAAPTNPGGVGEGSAPWIPGGTRVTLRRAVSTAAAGAGSERELFARLDRAGVLGPQAIQHPQSGRDHRLRRRPARRHCCGCSALTSERHSYPRCL